MTSGRTPSLFPDRSTPRAGVESLAEAFWRLARLDLLAGDRGARAWVTARDARVGGFLWWCGVSGLDPDVAARGLLDGVRR